MQDFNTMNPQNTSSNLRDEFEKYVYNWKWFLLGAILAIGLAFMYLRYTERQYKVSTTILINDAEKGGLTSELSAFEDLGLFGNGKTSLDNEIELLKSRTLLEGVVKKLGLNVTYFTQGRVKEIEQFQHKIPININFLTKDSIFYKLNTSFSVLIKSNIKFEIIDDLIHKEYTFGEKVITSFGDIIITPKNIKDIKIGEKIEVKIAPLVKTVQYYKEKIAIQLVNKKASVIELSLTHPVKEKAKKILNELVIHYNLNTIDDKRLIGENTDEFINNRLEIINDDLSNVDKGVEQFKTKNKLTNISSESSLILETNAKLENKIVDLNTQIKLANYVNDYIADNSDRLIPSNLGLTDASISGNTQRYNELILERNRILKSSSKLNPVIVNLNDQISNLRSSISQSLANLKSTLNISLNDIVNQESRLNYKITSVPKQEREFRDIQRQQQIIESLYLYLLEKREENAISLAVTLPNAKIIDKAYGSDIPVEPKKRIVYLSALLLGLLIPFSIIYTASLFDNKVHTTKEIEAVVKAPILGSIPKTKKAKKIVVSDNNRDSIAESFRLLRTNINFMLAKVEKKSKIIFVTSTLPAEGKTFISINMASVLALSNKKVLLIGADIRKPKISKYLKVSSEKGLTHFLMDKSIEIKDIIEPFEESNFDILHSGLIAPNPSELLMNGRFKEVLSYGEEHYDYVIVDTAPVHIVTDTLLISSYADLFIYVIRANYLDKRLLEIPKNMYAEKRLPNMAVLINDIDIERSYEYSYGQGYGYGETSKKKSWLKRMLKAV